MFKFFNYCFYRLANATKSMIDYNVEWAAIIVAVAQASNILSISAIILKQFYNYEFEAKVTLYVYIPLVILNIFFLYNTKKFEKLKIKWENENKKYKKLKMFFIWFYIILSFLFFWLTLGGNLPCK
ncbi:MAG: hypothetical protein WC142_06625 [Bacteroidales bacterium]